MSIKKTILSAIDILFGREKNEPEKRESIDLALLIELRYRFDSEQKRRQNCYTLIGVYTVGLSGIAALFNVFYSSLSKRPVWNGPHIVLYILLLSALIYTTRAMVLLYQAIHAQEHSYPPPFKTIREYLSQYKEHHGDECKLGEEFNSFLVDSYSQSVDQYSEINDKKLSKLSDIPPAIFTALALLLVATFVQFPLRDDPRVAVRILNGRDNEEVRMSDQDSHKPAPEQAVDSKPIAPVRPGNKLTMENGLQPGDVKIKTGDTPSRPMNRIVKESEDR